MIFFYNLILRFENIISIFQMAFSIILLLLWSSLCFLTAFFSTDRMYMLVSYVPAKVSRPILNKPHALRGLMQIPTVHTFQILLPFETEVECWGRGQTFQIFPANRNHLLYRLDLSQSHICYLSFHLKKKKSYR